MTSIPPKVLIADDDASIRLVLSHAFARAGFQVRATGAVAALMKWAAEGEGDVLVTDVLMPDENMLEALPRLRRLRPSLPIIVMSAQNTLLTAVAATERGAFEYMPKPFDLDEMVAAAKRALVTSRPAGPAPRPSRDARPPLAGRSAAMQAVYRSLARLVAVDLPVLITGETGSGKTLAARALHDLGPRREAPIIEVRMAAVESPDFVLPLPSADYADPESPGTLVLDEVGDLSLKAQGRLVGLLDRIYDSTGGERLKGPRLVATTSRDLEALASDGLFRSDLRHRLAVASIDMPPLRMHREDLGEIARVFLTPEGAAAPERTLDPDALTRLEAHDWPGNVRELHNLLRRLAAYSPGPRITSEALERELAARVTVVSNTGENPVDAHLTQAVAAAFSSGRPEPGLHERLTTALERPLLQSALLVCEGNQLRAAELLGLNRNTLRKRLSDLGLKVRG